MLDYAELTVVKNAAGISTALGYPINSFLLQNNKPLFVGGGSKKGIDYENLAVPAGLVCMTETRCMRADATADSIEDTYSGDDAYALEDERDIVPEGLYERLMELAETKQSKKLTKRKPLKPKNKTKKVIKKTKSKR